MFGKNLSDEVKKKISDAMSGKDHPMFGKTGENHHNFGKTCSEEIRAKISASLKGHKGAVHPHAQKISVSDLELDTKISYNSLKEASRALNILQSSISNYLINNRKKPYKGRYIFTKID
jgi:group I intron endonuclease